MEALIFALGLFTVKIMMFFCRLFIFNKGGKREI